MHNPRIQDLQTPCSLQQYLTLIFCPALFSLLCLSIPIRPPQRFLSLDNARFLVVLATIPAAIVSSNYARSLMLLGLPRRPWTRAFPICTILSVSIAIVISNMLTMSFGKYPLPLNILCTSLPCDIVFGGIGMFLTLRRQDQIFKKQKEQETPKFQVLKGTAQPRIERFGKRDHRLSIGLQSNFQNRASRRRVSNAIFVASNDQQTCEAEANRLSDDQGVETGCVRLDKEDVGGFVCLDEQWTRGLPCDDQSEKARIRPCPREAAGHAWHTNREGAGGAWQAEEGKGRLPVRTETRGAGGAKYRKSEKEGKIGGATEGDAHGFECCPNIVLLDQELPDETQRNRTTATNTRPLDDLKEFLALPKLAKKSLRVKTGDLCVDNTAKVQPEAAFKDRFKACARVSHVLLFFFVLCNTCYVVTLMLGSHMLYVFLALQVCAITATAFVRKAIFSATHICRQSSSHLVYFQLYGTFMIHTMLEWFLLILMPSSGTWNAFGLAFLIKVASFAFDCWSPSHAALRVTQQLRVFSPFPMYVIPPDVSCCDSKELHDADPHQHISRKGQHPSTPLATFDQSDDSDDDDSIHPNDPWTIRQSFVRCCTPNDPEWDAEPRMFKPLVDSKISFDIVSIESTSLSSNRDARCDPGHVPIPSGAMCNTCEDSLAGDVTGLDHVLVGRRQSIGQNAGGVTCHKCYRWLGEDVTSAHPAHGGTCPICCQRAVDDVKMPTSAIGRLGKFRRHSSDVIDNQRRADDFSAVCRVHGHKTLDDVTSGPMGPPKLCGSLEVGYKHIDTVDSTWQACAECNFKPSSWMASAGLGRPRLPGQKDATERERGRGKGRGHETPVLMMDSHWRDDTRCRGAANVVGGVTSPVGRFMSVTVVDDKGPFGMMDVASDEGSDAPVGRASPETCRDVIGDPSARSSSVRSPAGKTVGALTSCVTPLTSACLAHHRGTCRRSPLRGAAMQMGPHTCPECRTQVHRVVLGIHLFLRLLRQLTLCVSQTILFSFLYWTGYNWNQWLPFPMEDGRLFVSLCLSGSSAVLYVLLFLLARHWQMRTFAVDPFYWGSRYVANFYLELTTTLTFIIIAAFGVTCTHFNVFHFFFREGS